MLRNQLPLGLDRLAQIFQANAECRLMELFLFHFRRIGYTLQHVFLRTPAFGTADPANLEAILSTHSKGKQSLFLLVRIRDFNRHRRWNTAIRALLKG